MAALVRLLKGVGIFLAALVILFEEWLWDPLKRLMDAFGRLPLIRQIGHHISALPPSLAIFVFAVPMLILLPFKLAGLWLIGSGHPVLGLEIFLLAKVTGTALVAWLFGLTKPALLQLSWFAKMYGIVQSISHRAHEFIHRHRLYRWARRAIERVKDEWKRRSHM